MFISYNSGSCCWNMFPGLKMYGLTLYCQPQANSKAWIPTEVPLRTWMINKGQLIWRKNFHSVLFLHGGLEVPAAFFFRVRENIWAIISQMPCSWASLIAGMAMAVSSCDPRHMCFGSLSSGFFPISPHCNLDSLVSPTQGECDLGEPLTPNFTCCFL